MKKILMIVGGVFITVTLIAIIAAVAFPASDKDEAPDAESTPTAIPATETPQMIFTEVVNDALGTSTNRNVPKINVAEVLIAESGEVVLGVNFAFDDNLSSGLIKRSAMIDVNELLEEITKSNLDYDVVAIQGTFLLVDTFGNEEETVVVTAAYLKSDLDQVNWDNFLTDNVYAISTTLEIHPAFRD